MNMEIWKYELSSFGHQIISMPKNAQILSAQIQYGTLCIWCLIDKNECMVKRAINVFATGQALPPLAHQFSFIDTVQMRNLVLHVFDQGEQENMEGGL